jgi:hypothetical protein
MTDDEKRKYHHKANEGVTRGPSNEEADPHHALNTPIEAIDEDENRAVLSTEEDEGERLEDADDRAEDVRTSEERSRGDRSSRE